MRPFCIALPLTARLRPGSLKVWVQAMNGKNMFKTLIKTIGPWMLLMTAVAGLYGQFLWNPLVFDDLPVFMFDAAGVQPIDARHFSPLELRSLPYATLAWTKALLGLELINFRLGNLLLHAAVALALFFFLSRLFEVVLGPHTKNRLSPRLAAFFAALLFALHPVATYAVGYLVQRTVVMATLFCLLSMATYVQGSVQNKPLWLWLSVPFYYLAVFSKEHAIMLPAVLVALTILLHGDWRARLAQRWPVFCALGAVAVIVLLATRGLIGSLYEPVAQGMLMHIDTQFAYPLSVLTQCWLFFKYALLWIFPQPSWMSVDMREPFAQSLLSGYPLAALCFIGWGLGAVWLLVQRGHRGLLGFGLLYPWLMFMTEFSAVRIQEIFVLYRSYLWVAGAFCVLPVVFFRVNARSASFVLALVALAMVPISMERLMVMSQPMFLWDDAEKLVKGRPDLPGAYRIYYNRGTELAGLGLMDLAMVDFKTSVALNPDFAEAHGNLGAAYAKKGDWDNAIVSFENAINAYGRGGKTFAQAQGNLGTAYFTKGDWARSVAAFSEAIRNTIDDGKAPSPRDLLGRAKAYEKLGEVQRAQADYRESCRLDNRGCEKVTGSAAAK